MTRRTYGMETMYEIIIGEYQQDGDEMIWTMRNGDEIMVKDMVASHIKNCITMLVVAANADSSYDARTAWVEIFTDVLMKRRLLKLEKIKTVINEKENKK